MGELSPDAVNNEPGVYFVLAANGQKCVYYSIRFAQRLLYLGVRKKQICQLLTQSRNGL